MRIVERLRGSFALAILLMVMVPVSFAAYPSVDNDAFWPQQQHVWVTGQSSGQTAGQAIYQGIVNAQTGAPVRVSGGLTQFPFTGQMDTQEMLSMLDLFPEYFQVGANEVEILHSGIVLGKSYLTARQLVDGVPVLGTRVLFRAASNGRVAVWGADVVQNGNKWSNMVSSSDAATYLAEYLGYGDFEVRSASEIWVRSENDLIAAYQVQLSGTELYDRHIGLVNAANGDILGYYNETVHADVEGEVRGPVFPYNLYDDPQNFIMPYQSVSVGNNDGFTVSDGTYLFSGLQDGGQYDFYMNLTGPWVQVINEDAPDAEYYETVTAPAEYNPLWTTEEHGIIDEFHMFYHTNFIHEFYDVLDPGFTGLDYPVPATVQYGNNYENAFWNGFGMSFGCGGGTLNNLALNSDIIYHEYTHGVTGRIYPGGTLPYQGQSGAMNEAWSDYFPGSIHDNPGMARGCYVGAPLQAMRNMDNNKSMPHSWVGEVHADSEIMSGALWHTREILGQAYSDSLFHYSRYGLASTFDDYLVEVLVADDDNGDISDGTPNAAVIYEQFERHGIGPGAIPNLVIEDFEVYEEDSDGYLMPGETIEFSFTVTNDVILYPPPAEDVTITVEDVDGINWVVDETAIPLIAPRETLEIPQRFRFTVDADAPVKFIFIDLNLTVSNVDYETTHRERLTLGIPDILLVNDSGDESYNDRLVDALIDLNTAAITINPITQGFGEVLTDYDAVIWITGDQQNPLSSTDIQRLVNYLDNSGNLILSGQHLTTSLNYAAELRGLLGVSDFEPDIDAVAAVGVEGNPFTDGHLVALQGGDSPNNQLSPSVLVPDESAELLYAYYPTMEGAAIWQPYGEEGGAATFGFGLEAISGVSNSQTIAGVIEPFLAHFGLMTDAPETHTETAIPEEFALSAPYPNPFNPATRISFNLPENGHVQLMVYDLLGREIMRVLDDPFTAGTHEINIDFSRQATGIYFLRMVSPFGEQVQKAVLIK